MEWQLKCQLELQSFEGFPGTGRSNCNVSQRTWLASSLLAVGRRPCSLLQGSPGKVEVPHNVTAGFSQMGENLLMTKTWKPPPCHFCNDSWLCLLWGRGHAVGCQCQIARPGRPSWRLVTAQDVCTKQRRETYVYSRRGKKETAPNQRAHAGVRTHTNMFRIKEQ